MDIDVAFLIELMQFRAESIENEWPQPLNVRHPVFNENEWKIFENTSRVLSERYRYNIDKLPAELLI